MIDGNADVLRSNITGNAEIRLIRSPWMPLTPAYQEGGPAMFEGSSSYNIRSETKQTSTVKVSRCDWYPRTLLTVLTLLATASVQVMAQSAPTIVVQWNNAALQGVRDSKLGPPMVARCL